MPFLSKFRLRYTLRTLFVVVTLLCVVLGSQVYKARKLREAAELVKRNGGIVMYAYERDYRYALMDKTTKLAAKMEEPKGPQWLRDQLGDAYFNDVVEVRLLKQPLTDDELREVSRFTGLKLLLAICRDDTTSIPQRNEVTDVGVAHLQSLRNLDTLCLVKTKITNEAVRSLRGLTNLEALDLEDNDLDDDCIPYFHTEAGDTSGFPHLKSLNLIGTRITNQGLAALVRQLPALEQIQVNRTRVTPAGVEAVRAQWKGQMFSDPPSP